MTTHILLQDQIGPAYDYLHTTVLVTWAINSGVGKLAKLNYWNLGCEQMVFIDTKTAEEIMNISIESLEWAGLSWERG